MNSWLCAHPLPFLPSLPCYFLGVSPSQPPPCSVRTNTALPLIPVGPSQNMGAGGRDKAACSFYLQQQAAQGSAEDSIPPCPPPAALDNLGHRASHTHTWVTPRSQHSAWLQGGFAVVWAVPHPVGTPSQSQRTALSVEHPTQEDQLGARGTHPAPRQHFGWCLPKGSLIAET